MTRRHLTPLSIEDLLSLYEASNQLHEQIWRLGANTGMRRSELFNLRRENIKDNGIYVVSGQGQELNPASGD